MPEVKQIESGKLLCLETRGSLQNVTGFFKQIEEFVKARQVPTKGEHLVIVYEEPRSINREEAHYAAALELAGDCTGNGEITVVIQGAMTAACECHQGPHEGLADVYQQMVTWIHEKGYTLAGPPREFYLVGPPGDPAAYMTEIQIPIQRPHSGEIRGA